MQGTNDWAQKRLDRAAEMKYAKELRDNAEAEKLKQQQAGDKILNVFNEASKLQVLPPDMERIQALDKELQKPLQEMIKKYGGDINMALNSGGYNNMVEYSQKLQNDPLVKDALRRAKDAAELEKDVMSGKILRPIYEDINGSKQKYNPEDRINDFLGGKAQDFSYRGGFEPFQADYRKSFAEVYGNSNRTPRKASREDVFNMAMFEAKKKGLSKDDAEYYSNVVADEYDRGLSEGTLTPYLYKSDNPLDNAVKQSVIDKNRASTNLSNTRANKIASGGGNDDPTLFWINKVVSGGEDTKFAIGELINTATGDGKVTSAEVIEPERITNYMDKSMVNNSGLPRIKVDIAVTGGGDRKKVFDLNNADDVAELSTMQSSKVNSKTFANRYNEYQNSKGKSNQSNTTKEQTYTIKGKTYTLKELNGLGYNEEQVKNYLNK